MWALNLKNMRIRDDKITCSIGEIMKTTSAKRHQEDLEFDAYPCKVLCVVHCMKQYIKRTENLRGEGEQRLFISTRPPHQGIQEELEPAGQKRIDHEWGEHGFVHTSFYKKCISQQSSHQDKLGYYPENCRMEVFQYIRKVLQETHQDRRHNSQASSIGVS